MRPSDTLIRDVARHLSTDPDFQTGLAFLINAERSSGFPSYHITFATLARSYPLPLYLETRWQMEAVGLIRPTPDTHDLINRMRHLTLVVLPREIKLAERTVKYEMDTAILLEMPLKVRSDRSTPFLDMANAYLSNRSPSALAHASAVSFKPRLIAAWSHLVVLAEWQRYHEGMLESVLLGHQADFRIKKESIVTAINHFLEEQPDPIPSDVLKTAIQMRYRFPSHIESSFTKLFHKAVVSVNQRFERRGKGRIIGTKSGNSNE